LGRSLASDRLVAEHAVLIGRVCATAARERKVVEIFDNAEDSLLPVLDSLLYSLAPLEFPHLAVERQRSI